MTAGSRAQVTRLTGQVMEHSEIKESSRRRHRFESRSTTAALEGLDQEEAHTKMSGLATKKSLEREWRGLQHGEYRQLAVSVGIFTICEAATVRRMPNRLHENESPCGGPSENGRGRNREGSRVPVSRHSASTRPGRHQRGGVSHQRRRRSHARRVLGSIEVITHFAVGTGFYG